MRLAVILGLAWLGGAGPAFGLDYVTLRQDDKPVRVEGRVLVTAQDGGLLLLARDGVIWTVEPKDLINHTKDQTPFQPLSAEETANRVLAGLPRGFDAHHTTHYVICYGTSRAYAQWCGGLFERLYAAFNTYWTGKGFALAEPEFPLVAVIFADRRAYEQYAQADLGDSAHAIVAYYSFRSNRMAMFDVTGLQAQAPVGRGGTMTQINRILAQPGAEANVANIVHEATHQIAFNCGLHTRYSDCPRWFSEGIAVFFETPDLSSAKGWKTIGAVNRPRLAQLREFLPNRPTDSLATLVTNDKRLVDVKQASNAYAEAWALTYFLTRQHPKQYVAYLKLLSAKQPMVWDDPEKRLAEFKQAFGDDLRKLDVEFVRYMMRIR